MAASLFRMPLPPSPARTSMTTPLREVKEALEYLITKHGVVRDMARGTFPPADPVGSLKEEELRAWAPVLSSYKAILFPGTKLLVVTEVRSRWPGFPGANYLEYGGSGGNGYGGGLFVNPGTSTVVNNTFQNDSSGGGLGQPGATNISYFPGYPVNGHDGSGTGGAISGNPALLENNNFAGNGAMTSGSDADSLTPLYVSQFTVNQGQIQRSNDTSVSVQFNQSTNVQALIDNGKITSAVQIVSMGSSISLTPDPLPLRRLDQHAHDRLDCRW